MDKKIFEVEISSSGPKGYETAAVLTMPCTQAEFHDALQRARIPDIRECKNELARISYPGITSAMIGRDVDLLELNLLAIRLTMLGEDDRMGLDGLLQIEKENHTTPFPLSRLINLTFNADICLLAPQVSDPKELGALLYEGEMLSDEAMALVDTMDEDSDFRERLLELLGEQHQEEHGGVFTSRGYAEPGGDFKEVYRKGEMFCFAHPSAPVVLEVRKGYFDDPSYRQRLEIEELPALRELLRQDAAHLDAIQASTASVREFALVYRLAPQEAGADATALRQTEQALRDLGFHARLAEEQDIKRILAVYYQQDVTTEWFEEYDGERWLKADGYCQAQTGMSLEEYRQELLTEESQIEQGPQM